MDRRNQIAGGWAIALLTAGITFSAISCIERRASLTSAQSCPAYKSVPKSTTAGSHELPLAVTFQACGAQLCLRPFTQALPVKVAVTQ